ncbi:hypothetical protein EDF59_102214 [Novosphingobium sp. ST904]|nr:hypothetical protein EDF59_102214 [Novosphingobium sp. ST904]
MTCRIIELPVLQFQPLFGMDPAELARHEAQRMTADGQPAHRCRVRRDDAGLIESLVPLDCGRHDDANPYRTACTIYIPEDVPEGERFVARSRWLRGLRGCFSARIEGHGGQQ